jgi:hypothetical protein
MQELQVKPKNEQELKERQRVRQLQRRYVCEKGEMATIVNGIG